MAESKGFFEVFKRYKPTEEKVALLNRATDAKFRYKQEPMQVEVELTFDTHEDAETIYEIEDECRALYNAVVFKIIPHFPPEEFSVARFDEITYEAAICGAITHGFFTNAEYSDDGEVITVSIPFYESGISFVRDANTEAILANILKSRYGVVRRVELVTSNQASIFEEEMEAKRRQILIDAEREGIERSRIEREERQKRAEEEMRAKDPHYDFEARSGLSSMTGISKQISETRFAMGASTYEAEGASLAASSMAAIFSGSTSLASS